MRSALLITLLFVCFTLQAQQYSRVKVSLDGQYTIARLAELGLDTDHGRLQPGRFFISEFADFEIAEIQAAGFRTEVLVEDLEAHRKHLEAAGEAAWRSLTCGDAQTQEWQTPANYQNGTMGGYFTYQEMLDILDDMAAQYPNLFKARQPITTDYLTHEGRPVYWVKISDNPNVEDAGEPQVLYTALHHAREPNSLSQMIFYMWYLLENYGTDEEVTYLVDNVEMYFVPCINPDGYIYNETTNPDGGGFWRKNRRDNGDGSFGVDLNRNYGYEWGFNNTGSSPNPASQTYRGPGPFSEPETQMIRDFCEAHQFQIAQNYHTYSDLLIFPWGYADAATPDHTTFQEFGSIMTRENNYLTGFASETVGYTVNGNSDDWMYGEQATKPKTFAMTPEVGPWSYGFWPPSTAIDGLNKEAMYLNLVTAHLVLNYGELTPESGMFISDLQGVVNFNLKKSGLAPGSLTVSLTPVSDNILSTGSPGSFGLLHLEETSGAIAYTLSPSIGEGDTVAFEMNLDNGLRTWRQTVTRVFSTNPLQVFLEPADNISQWSPFTDWDATQATFYSAPSSLTDSPGAPYFPSTVNDLVMKEPIEVKNAAGVFLNFWAKWDIEKDYDYAQVLLSVNGGSYIPLCGRYTVTGTPEQDPGEPVYDGSRPDWVREEMDLSQYFAPADSADFLLAFRMASDDIVELDGFYFDDLELVVVQGNITTTLDLDSKNFTLRTRPNPARDYVIIDLAGETGRLPKMELQVFNTLGQMVARQPAQGSILRLETANWQPGIYQYRLKTDGQVFPAGRFVISGD